MSAFVLFHVILPSECLVARGTPYILFSRMLLAMASRMSRCCKGVMALITSGMWTRIFLFANLRCICVGSGYGLAGSRGGGDRSLDARLRRYRCA